MYVCMHTRNAWKKLQVQRRVALNGQREKACSNFHQERSGMRSIGI